ncbi:hypothetical protein K461DRAFT_274260 [Myriangium duriaei CBS 260.36]|uniref:REJ domain-containing protein n=1 Tax=Myriangium duriaei CBS 260.36 TaxID=1168546 RepID=A0A9P4JFS2_9PEZI|nr:hypothetical protein K461DRAFT_274260 [Myriangium duriaei CBS 260.36]
MQSSTQDNQQRSQRLTRSANAMRASASPYDRTRSEESWIEIASQPSSSSLSSAADEIVTTGLRVQDMARRRRRPRSNLVPAQSSHRPRSNDDISSQEEYEESESESDRVMTSSNEGLVMNSAQPNRGDDGCLTDDENRTAVNYPIRNTNTDASAFTPQPNAFSHPPHTYTVRTASEPGPGSYFPQMPPRSEARHSFSSQEPRPRPYPHNTVSHSQSAAAHHDAALRASLSTLLSCAAAARGLPKARSQQATAPQPRPTNRVDTGTLRLIPESALPRARSPVAANAIEPSFPPTLRQRSASSTSGSPDSLDAHKRKTGARGTSKERRASKKPRRASSASSASTVYSADDVFVSPTLLTWVVSAGVVVVLSAISFSAGYSIGREAGKMEASSFAGAGGEVGSCASEAGRSGMGLRRLRFTAQV